MRIEGNKTVETVDTPDEAIKKPGDAITEVSGEQASDPVTHDVAVIDENTITGEVDPEPPKIDRKALAREGAKKAAKKSFDVTKYIYRLGRATLHRINKGERPKSFSKIIMLLLIFYVTLELVFNTQILDVAGVHMSELSLRTVELFGRASAGFGVTLLLVDRFVFPKDWVSAVAFSLGIFVTVWPVVFFGQEILFNKVVDSSSPEMRRDAYMASGVKNAIVSNDLVLNDLSVTADNSAAQDGNNPGEITVSQRTIATYLGSLIVLDKDLLKALEPDRTKIIEAYAYNTAMNQFDGNYDKYNELKAEMQRQYAEYLVINNEFKEAIKDPAKLVKTSYEEINVLAERELKNHLAELESRRQKYTNNAQKTMDALLHYQSVMDNCKSATIYCRKQAMEDYRIRTQLLDQVIEPLKLLTHTSDKAIDIDLIVDVYVEVFGADDYSGKYPEFVTTKTDLMRTVVFNNLVKDHYRNKGMVMPANWVTANEDMFDQALKIFAKTKQVPLWKERMSEIGLALPPDVTWEQFQMNDVVQDHIKHEIGEDVYVYPVMATWNNQEFYDNLYDTVINRKVQDAINYSESPNRYFADGGLYEDEGKNAVRAIVVPALITAISLFLIITTMTNIIEAALEKGEQFKWRARILKLSALSMLFITPVIVYELKYEAEIDSTSRAMIANTGFVGSTIMKWVIASEHAIYPAGKFVDEKLKITQFFVNHMEDDLEDLDCIFCPGS